MYSMFKTFANSSRPVRDACEDFAIPCERLATGSRIDSKTVPNSSHPSEIGAYKELQHILIKRTLVLAF